MANKGNELFQLFLELSGLGKDAAETELLKLMKRLNIDPETVGTDDIRRLMAAYLDEFDSEMSGALLLNSAVSLANKAEA